MTFGSLPPSLITAPPYEWPTRMTGPSRRAIARLVAATSSAREVSGFCTATAFKPAFLSSGITLAQLEPSAHAPWTRTIAGLLPCAMTGFVKAPMRTRSPAATMRVFMRFPCKRSPCRYGSAKRDAGILRPPAKDSYVVEATIWDTRDGDAAEVAGSPGDTIGVAPTASRGMAVKVAFTTFRKRITRRRYARL